MTDTAEARLIEEVTRRVIYRAFDLEDPSLVVVGISNRHVHLSEEDFAVLFGRADMTVYRQVRQHGEYAAEETITVHGPKASMARVRVMGPFRHRSQVELSRTDCIALGVDAPITESGRLDSSAPVDIEGPCGRLHLEHAAMVAGRHVHLGTGDAARLGVADGDRISVRVSGRRGGILDNFLCRVKESYVAEAHIDTDEGNAFDVKTGDYVRILGR